MTVSPAATTDLEVDFPDFYRAADTESLSGQKRYTTCFRAQLVLLLLAALFGAFVIKFGESQADWAGVISAVSFVGAALVRGYLWQARPEKDWYAGRAAAESTKTLAWRLSVAADPFPLTRGEEAARTLFLNRLGDIRRPLKGAMVLASPQMQGEVTASMLRVRNLDLPSRRAIYLEQRVKGQMQWYAKKARANKRRSRQWAVIMLFLELGGATGAILKATGVIEVDVLGLIGAVVAALAAWAEMRQFDNLSNAYSVAANELSEVHARGLGINTEVAWSTFVANAEEAISREHTLWVASREG